MKKTIKILLIFIFLVTISYAIYFYILKNNNTNPPEPLIVSEPTIIWSDNRTLSILFEIKNPNIKYGSNNFSYKINLFDDHDNIVKSIQKSLFIYANTTETLVENKIDTGNNLIGRAEVIIEKIDWISASDFKQPIIKTESMQTTKENNFYKVEAKISNPNSYDISKIVFNAVLYSEAGQVLAVARLDSDSMKANRSKGLIAYLNIDPSMERYLDISATKYYIYLKK